MSISVQRQNNSPLEYECPQCTFLLYQAVDVRIGLTDLNSREIRGNRANIKSVKVTELAEQKKHKDSRFLYVGLKVLKGQWFSSSFFPGAASGTPLTVPWELSD